MHSDPRNTRRLVGTAIARRSFLIGSILLGGGVLAVVSRGSVVEARAGGDLGEADQPIRDGLKAWRDPTGDWQSVGAVSTDPENDGRLTSAAGTGVIVNGERGRTRNLLTSKEYGDVQAHVEFLVPRGSNSGVYFMGRYEIQVLDSWGVKEPKYGDCGGIYQRWDPRRGRGNEGFEGRPPRVNAARKPGEWQCFDVIFKAPRFDADGNKVASAQFVKVIHNGIVVHENEELSGPTRAAALTDERPVGPLMLQGDHGPVAYRNIRIWSLADGHEGGPEILKREAFVDHGFVSVFDGKTLDGWHVSSQTGHSRASGGKTGGKWVVKDGAIVGSQDLPGNGGIIVTDKRYRDFEVIVEMKSDYGPDSGLFLRSTERGAAYQYMVDYHNGGNLAGIYGEGLSGRIGVRNFSFLDDVTRIRTHPAAFSCPIRPSDWPRLWRHGEWNELRARIEGNPPSITTWINGVRFMEFKDTEKRHVDAGSIALQVHGGGDFTTQYVRYRNVRVKELR